MKVSSDPLAYSRQSGADGSKALVFPLLSFFFFFFSSREEIRTISVQTEDRGSSRGKEDIPALARGGGGGGGGNFSLGIGIFLNRLESPEESVRCVNPDRGMVLVDREWASLSRAYTCWSWHIPVCGPNVYLTSIFPWRLILVCAVHKHVSRINMAIIKSRNHPRLSVQSLVALHIPYARMHFAGEGRLASRVAYRRQRAVMIAYRMTSRPCAYADGGVTFIAVVWENRFASRCVRVYFPRLAWNIVLINAYTTPSAVRSQCFSRGLRVNTNNHTNSRKIKARMCILWKKKREKIYLHIDLSKICFLLFYKL